MVDALFWGNKMSKAVQIRVSGLRDFGDRLKRLDSDMSNKIARAATASAAGVIKKIAVRKAPIAAEDYEVEGQKVPRGNVPKNIISKRLGKSESNLTSEHIVTLRAKRKDGYAARIGALNEFGTVNMAAQPFIRPAFDEGKDAALQAMTQRIHARLKKAGV